MNEINEPSFSALKCNGCGGIWFNDADHEIAKTIKGAANIDDGDTNSASAYSTVREVDCPQCNQKMMKMTDRTQLHIQFEACPDGHGVFFDSGEFKDLSDFSLFERVKQTIETLKSNLKA